MANSPLGASFANAKTVFRRQGKNYVTRSFTFMYGISGGMLNLLCLNKMLLPAKMHGYMWILVKILFLSIQYSKALTSGVPKTARTLLNETFIIIIKVM